MEHRQARMTARLINLPGATAEAAIFVNEVDQLIPFYQQMYGEFKERYLDDDRPIQAYAIEQLLQLDSEGFTTEYELKRHVYALGKLAGRTGQQNRAVCKA